MEAAGVIVCYRANISSGGVESPAWRSSPDGASVTPMARASPKAQAAGFGASPDLSRTSPRSRASASRCNSTDTGTAAHDQTIIHMGPILLT
jgi:hypothetical protein